MLDFLKNSILPFVDTIINGWKQLIKLFNPENTIIIGITILLAVLIKPFLKAIKK